MAAANPLWFVDDVRVGDIDPRKLPISRDLVVRLMTWSQRHNDRLNWDDPASTRSGRPRKRRLSSPRENGLQVISQLSWDLRAVFSIVPDRWKHSTHSRRLTHARVPV
jgi:hypothetical protein